ncbi:pilus assembly protein [Mesorhizobium sp. LHD-90]|uniref:TadE/TadG family type IV pilus assembly protein n=1 Tax=Mesorhizobium sp. LHD-90 TaxID=3071414 RepID=UPI0027E0E877|nr:pilus assembly protein [Mesorhizobium sp. LHD-90]MDQ6436126.1 pilus assembly protein [Mesorhizobium sp. LHD-90]
MSRFAGSRDGNFALIMAFAAIPLVLAVGFSADYTMAIQSRSGMQNALDAATLSIVNMPKTATNEEREVKLKEFYAANGGQGTAKLESFVIGNTGSADAESSAEYDVPTNFMGIARIDKVPVDVKAEVHKEPSLIKTTFEIEGASGWWDKTMTLWGGKYGDPNAQKLLQISYAYNKGGDPKGYGTMTISTVSKDAQGREVLTPVQKQVCTTKNVNTFNDAPPGSIKTTTSSGQKKLTTCVTTTMGAAEADVSQMNSLYLEMKIPNPNPGLNGGRLPTGTKETLRSDDPNTSNRLYLGGVEVETGKKVDIFTVVPCGETSKQSWEDGGNAVPAPVSNADFHYKVTGKCDYTPRPLGISLAK